MRAQSVAQYGVRIVLEVDDNITTPTGTWLYSNMAADDRALRLTARTAGELDQRRPRPDLAMVARPIGAA
ncbi:hypothetical protein [Actinomadura sp. 6N118]|uniref:hypothetical protein n=1 Tax=Actinomadura sp. 6N118 TaxID=3375151 RepID=UPI0037BA18C2